MIMKYLFIYVCIAATASFDHQYKFFDLLFNDAHLTLQQQARQKLDYLQILQIVDNPLQLETFWKLLLPWAGDICIETRCFVELLICW